MKKKRIIILIAILLASFAFYFFILTDMGQDRMIKEGNQIISEIETFKELNGKLPS